MKKVLMMCLAFGLLVNSSQAAFTSSSKEEKKENYGSFKNAETKAMAEMFVKMSRQEYEQVTGRHLSITERLAFKVQQKHIKKELQKASGGSDSKIIGFLAGLILSLVGVLLVYLLSDDSTMQTWAWIGALVSLILFGALLI